MEKTPKAVTFPIRTTDTFMIDVGKAAEKEGKSKHEFVVDAVSEKVEKLLHKKE